MKFYPNTQSAFRIPTIVYPLSQIATHSFEKKVLKNCCCDFTLKHISSYHPSYFNMMKRGVPKVLSWAHFYHWWTWITYLMFSGFVCSFCKHKSFLYWIQISCMVGQINQEIRAIYLWVNAKKQSFSSHTFVWKTDWTNNHGLPLYQIHILNSA